MRRLVAGPNGVFICDECAALVVEMTAEPEGIGAPGTGGASPTRAGAPGHYGQPDAQSRPGAVRAADSSSVGHRVWLIPDGYLPPASHPGSLQSHEAVCVLNTGPAEATVRLTIYFEDREPLRDLTSRIPGERTLHLRLDRPEHTGGVPLPTGVPYAIKLESDVPVIVQHSRLDATQPALALFTTMAYPQLGS